MQAGTVEAVGAQLLSAVRTSGALTDEQLSSLHFIYGTNLAKALQIVDQGGVACYVGAGSGRRVFLVHGHAAEHYLVHPDHYCSCQVRRQGRGRGGCPTAGRRAAAGTSRLQRSTALPAPTSPPQAFFFDVVSKDEAVACKHQLAARLAAALGKAREQTVSDLHLAHLLQEG